MRKFWSSVFESLFLPLKKRSHLIKDMKFMSPNLNFVLFKKPLSKKKHWTNSCILSFYFEIKENCLSSSKDDTTFTAVYVARKGILLPKLFQPFVKKIVLVVEKNFWNSSLKAENLQNSLRSREQFIPSVKGQNNVL